MEGKYAGPLLLVLMLIVMLTSNRIMYISKQLEMIVERLPAPSPSTERSE